MAERRVFGTTWWGKAWTDALQRRARLDANRLPRGRTYARHDRVHDIELSKGDQFTATGTTEILDTDGDLILTGCNTLTGTRLE